MASVRPLPRPQFHSGTCGEFTLGGYTIGGKPSVALIVLSAVLSGLGALGSYREPPAAALAPPTFRQERRNESRSLATTVECVRVGIGR